MRYRDWLAGGGRAAATLLLVAATARILLPGDAPAAAVPRPAIIPPPAARPAPRPPEPAAAQGLVVRHILAVPEPMRIGDWRWDEAGAPTGPTVLTVDLAAGMLSIFRGGYEVGTAAIVYGGDEKPTPLGTFPITQKDAHHISNLYHAEMPYMQRLTNDGITIHGTEGIRSGWATHGCVGVPVAFAKRLFGATRIGDPVIVTRGKRLAMGEAIVTG